MTRSKFTVVIPSYNRGSYIKKAIHSVLDQSYTQWKLLIMDDASTDDTIKQVEPYLKDERIRLITLSQNEGISYVLNRALLEVDTPYFIQLDSDDWLSKHCLKEFHMATKKHPGAALYYGNVRMWMKNKTGNWKVFKRIHHRPFQNKLQFLLYMTYMLHPRCYLTDALRQVGGWETSDPYGGRIMEDRRMVVKLMEKYRVHWINRYLYNRRKHSNQLTNHADFQARNVLRKRLVTTSLRKWGNRYEPVFALRKGLLIVKRLIPLKKKRVGD